MYVFMNILIELFGYECIIRIVLMYRWAAFYIITYVIIELEE
jgi:hypothetical protein